MEQNTRGTGAIIKPTDMENSGMLTEMFMKESGSMTKPTDMEYMSM
jgi:hypothetical protein